LRHYQQVRELLKHEIEQADYLLFSAYALIGDWAIVATHEAVKLRRKYGLDADVVYDKRAELSWDRPEERFRLAKLKLLLPLFRRMYRYCLEHSALALLQGQDVYDAYAPFCRNPHKVYHMPVSEEDYITNAQMQQKLSLLSEARPLRLCYVGRCIEIKGPWDWLRVLHGLMANKVEFRAEWLGDGSLLPKMRAMAAELGVADYVQFQGYVGRRDDILETLRSADMFLFCHKTPESPRCLVEALVSGCPLVGYGSAYPRDLVAEHGGGDFVEIGDCQGLVEKVKRLNDNRQKIRALIKAAGDSGRLFERDATMQRRIDLIVRYLGADGT
jgi:glycosyltransferase involved in cell wall biosynthesis